MYLVLRSLFIGLLVALIHASPVEKTDATTKALEQRSNKEPPPFNPDPDVDYHGPERPTPQDSQSEYRNCIVKFMYNQVIRRHRHGRDPTTERLAFTQTEAHCYAKALRKWGVAPQRRAAASVVEEQIQRLETHRDQILRGEERWARRDDGAGGGVGGGGGDNQDDGLKARFVEKLRAARERFRSFFTRFNTFGDQDGGPVRGGIWAPPRGSLGGAAFGV